MKPTLFALLASITFQGAYAYDFISDYLAYSIVSDTEVMVTSNPDVTYPEELNIPSTVIHNDVAYEVIGIAPLAFYGNRDISIVTLEEGIGSIGYKSLSGTTLTKIVLPPSLHKIEDEAFWQCETLEAVEGMEFVEEIGMGAFRDCNVLEELNLNGDLTEVPASAFEGCRTISEVSLPVSIEILGDRAFAACTSLRYINMPDGVKSIGSHCFAQCRELAYLNLPEELEEIGPYALSGCLTVKEQEWPAGVENLPEGILSACSALEFAYIGPEVRTVGANAYQGCTALETVSIAEYVERIGSYAFADCPTLRYVYVDNLLPPIIQPNTFDTVTFEEGILYVRPEVKALYSQSAQWSKFAHVESSTTFPTHAGLEDTEVAARFRVSGEILSFGAGHGRWSVYSVDGRIIGTGMGEGSLTCPPGLYILQWSDGENRKVII